MKLSIIMPLYNVANFIESTLDKIFRDNLNSDLFELILVNDGSSDNTLELVEFICRGRTNVTVLSQANLGPGGARNFGILHAKGLFILFLDSDDFYEYGALSLILDSISCDINIDILKFEYQKKTEDGRLIKKSKVEKLTKPGNGIMCGHQYLVEKFGVMCYTWSFCYRTDFLKKIKIQFKNNMYYEDVDWLPRVILAANRISFLDAVLYNYVLRPESTMNNITARNKRIFDMLILIDILFNNKDLPYKWRKMMLAVLSIRTCCGSVHSLSLVQQEVIDKISCFLPLQLACLPINYKVLGFFLNLGLFFKMTFIFKWLKKSFH